MTGRCDVMARQKLKAKEKKTQKITKYGLIEKSQETGKQNNISNKVSDFSLDKKQSKGQNEEKTKEEKQGGRTARLASLKKKQQRKIIQKTQLENEIKNDIPLYEQNFSVLENNTIIDVALSNEENQQEQQYQPTKSNVTSDFKKKIVKKAISKNKKETKLQDTAKTKTASQNQKTKSNLHCNNKSISDRKEQKTNKRQIRQKLHDVPITKLKTSENDIAKKEKHKKQQTKTAENVRTTAFSPTQKEEIENILQFHYDDNKKQYHYTEKEQSNYHLEFEHKKQQQKLQKLNFQKQEYKPQKQIDIQNPKKQYQKMQFSKTEQQNFSEIAESEKPQNNFNQNTETKSQKFYFDNDEKSDIKKEKSKNQKLQYYYNEKQQKEQNQCTNEKQENNQSQNEKEISSNTSNTETKKEISIEDKLKLEKLENKVQKAQQKLEKAEKKLPKKTKIKFEKSFDEKTNTSKTKFHIEKEVKPQYQVKPIRSAVKRATFTPPSLLWHKGHQKISETEKENTAVEVAHKNEQRAEFLLKNGYRKWSYNRKNKPYRTVTKMEKRLQKANTKYHMTKFSIENQKLKTDETNKKWLQKHNIKKKYAQMVRQKQSQESVRTAKDVFVQVIRAISHVASTQKTVIGIIAVVGVLFILSSSLIGSCSAMLSGAGTSTFVAAYTANDEEINAADLYYTELETNLQYTINHIEQTYTGYDEYRYNIGEIGHNPYKLMAYLSAMYDFFAFEEIKNDIEELFHKQYHLQVIPKTEIRYDSDGNASDWHVLEVTLAVKPMEQTTIPLMNQCDCKYKYDVYMETYGNRQNFGNPFSFSWLSYVSGQYGYRLNEQGEKELHRGIDLKLPQNTSILAIQDGVISEISSDRILGNYIVMEDGKGYQSKFAGWQRCSVSVGQEIKKGEEIAFTGNIPFHLEVTHQGQYLNPMYFVENGDDGKGSLPGTEGGITIPEYPGSAMGDGSFGALITEAEKYLGYPYVWGGSNPNTSFDCSGFICWVYTQSGVHNLPRTTAQGIYNQCTPVSIENAKPGDLIFFTGTYDSANPVSHIGMYVGNGQMLHAGDPISYANINSNYWEKHFYGFGRLS